MRRTDLAHRHEDVASDADSLGGRTKVPVTTRRNVLRIAGATAVGGALVGTGPGVLVAHAAPVIVSRQGWGFDGWAKPVGSVARNQRTHFVVHWRGIFRPLPAPMGPGVPRKMHEEAKEENGPGIEYNHVITQAGEVYEGRGFELLAGAVANFNTPAISVQIHTQAPYSPSADALRALEWLYLESHRVLGDRHAGPHITRALEITGHKDHFNTDCPGPDLMRWVAANSGRLKAQAQAILDGQSPPPPPPPPAVPPFPGEDAFQIGKEHPAVVDLDNALIRKGYTRHHDGDGYQAGTVFTEYTRLNVRDFQLDQGWTGSGADGFPGPQTWDRLMR